MKKEYDILNNLINKKINSEIKKFNKQLDSAYYEFKMNLLKILENNLNKTKLEIVQMNNNEMLIEDEFFNTLRIILINSSKIESNNCIGIIAKEFYSNIEAFHYLSKRDMNKLLHSYDAVKTQKNKNRVTCLVRVNGNTTQVINIKKDFINKYNLLEGEE